MSVHSFKTMNLLLKFNAFTVSKLLNVAIKEKTKHFKYVIVLLYTNYLLILN